MAAVATPCLSTELKTFLSSDSKVNGPAGHQLLRKLLSICTGKCELGEQHSLVLPDLGKEDVEQPAAVPHPAAQRALRPRRRTPQLERLMQQVQGQAQQQEEQQQQQQQREEQQQQPRLRPVRCRRPLQEQEQQQPAQQRQQQEQQQLGQERGGPQGECSPDNALCSDLLSIIRRERGVVLALALHAMHIWAQGSTARTQACIRQGIIPMLVQVLAAVLCESPPTPTGAYASSMAVILLRTLTRSGEEGMASFVGGSGVRGLLRLLPTLHEDRALCLALYLLSDVTRRSVQALAQATEAGGVALVVDCLRHPLGESTKFAALLINRWCLLAPPMGAAFRSAGALASLLGVLRRQHSAAQQGGEAPAGAATKALLSEVSAYSLSALAILGQEDPAVVREMLVGCPANLAAVTRAMTDYERSFQGTGFPHALLSFLLEGPEGCSLAAQVMRYPQLLPAWLALRQVGWEFVERTAQADVLNALESLPAEAQGDVVQSLSLLLPHSPAFFSSLTNPERLATLTRGAVAELLVATSPFSASSAAARPALPPPPASCVQQAIPAAAAAGGGAAAATAAAAASMQAPPAPAVQHAQQQQQNVEEAGSPRAITRAPATPESLSQGLDEDMTGSSPANEGRFEDLAEGQLQRGVSIIPEALRLEAISQQEQQAEQEQGEQRQQQQPAPAVVAPLLSIPTSASSTAEGLGVTSGSGPASAPFCTALWRLLAAWSRGPPGATLAAAAPVSSSTSSSGSTGPKRGHEERGSEAQHAKRARFAFGREDVNVKRYDSLVFLVGGREFHAVGFVLEAHSPLLRTLLRTLGSLSEALPIPCIAGFSPDRMYTLFGWAVEYCYTGGVEGLDARGALDLWTLAEFLQIDGLQRECEAALWPPGSSTTQRAQHAQQGGAQGGQLLAERYQLGLAYPCGSRLRLGVACDVLALWAAMKGPLPAGDGAFDGRSSSAAAAAATSAAPWNALGAEVVGLLAAHPGELAADMARALQTELLPCLA